MKELNRLPMNGNVSSTTERPAKLLYNNKYNLVTTAMMKSRNKSKAKKAKKSRLGKAKRTAYAKKTSHPYSLPLFQS